MTMSYAEAIEYCVKNWDALKKLQDPKNYRDDWDTAYKTLIGKAHWHNPKLLWVYITDNEEGYDGSQTQVGIKKNGSVVYEYQSHCSCNDYKDSHGEGCPMPENTTKSFSFESIPNEWKDIVAANVTRMANELLDLEP